MKKNQKGFGAVEFLLLLMLVVMVSFAGWYVWNSNKKADTSLTSADKSSNTTAVAPIAAKKYLVIKEKGIKIELTDQIKDTYYKVSNQGYIYLSLHRYDNMKGFESCAAEGGESGSGLAALSSAKVGDDNRGEPYTLADLNNAIDGRGAKIGDTYYWLESPNAPCWDPDAIPESDQRVQDYFTLKNALSGQGKTIVKI
jgi:uncharacterized protein (UPF0333 family)